MSTKGTPGPKPAPALHVDIDRDPDNGRVTIYAHDSHTGARSTMTVTRGAASTLGGLLSLASLPDQDADEFTSAHVGELTVSVSTPRGTS
jgi:hypothetical protein